MSFVNNKSSYIPLDCQYCGFMLRDSSDCVQYGITGCCVECWWGFLEPLRKLNKDDEYLPNDREIKAYKEKITAENMQC